MIGYVNTDSFAQCSDYLTFSTRPHAEARKNAVYVILLLTVNICSTVNW